MVPGSDAVSQLVHVDAEDHRMHIIDGPCGGSMTKPCAVQLIEWSELEHSIDYLLTSLRQVLVIKVRVGGITNKVVIDLVESGVEALWRVLEERPVFITGSIHCLLVLLSLGQKLFDQSVGFGNEIRVRIYVHQVIEKVPDVFAGIRRTFSFDIDPLVSRPVHRDDQPEFPPPRHHVVVEPRGILEYLVTRVRDKRELCLM